MSSRACLVAQGDVDGDGILDIFVTNFSEDFSTLYKGRGRAFYEDVSKTTGDTADEVVLRWPDGTRSVHRNVPVRQFLVVRKGT